MQHIVRDIECPCKCLLRIGNLPTGMTISYFDKIKKIVASVTHSHTTRQTTSCKAYKKIFLAVIEANRVATIPSLPFSLS